MLDQLNEWMFLGEGDELEFKQAINDEYKIAKTLCAFANTKGGVLLVGVKDNRTICGIDPDEERHLIEKAANFCCSPAVKIEMNDLYLEPDNGQKEEKIILQVVVPESNEKPHFALNVSGEKHAYIRQQDNTLLAGKKMLQVLKSQKHNINIKLSNNEKRLIDFLQKHNKVSLQKYMQLVNIGKRRARRELDDMLRKGMIKIFEHEHEDYFVLN
ncbi:MAG: helix-turn-helix domain-containing protein [Cyclobacteriaceae bacterium]